MILKDENSLTQIFFEHTFVYIKAVEQTILFFSHQWN